MDERSGEHTYELTDGQTDRIIDRQTDGRRKREVITDRRADKETSYHRQTDGKKTSYHRQNIKGDGTLDLFNQTIFITHKVYALLSLIIEIHLTVII